MEKKVLISAISILILSIFVVTIVWFKIYKENFVKGTYKSVIYGYSFQVPSSLSVVRTRCEENLVGIKCLEKFTITPKSYSQADLKYLNIGTIAIFKGLEHIRFVWGNGGSDTFYDIKNDKWLLKSPVDDGYKIKEITPLNIGNNKVYVTSNGGSHGGENVYLITDKDRNMIFVVEIPFAKRIRCDFIKDIYESRTCENYLLRIHAQEGWTPETFFLKFFKDKDIILSSFRWEPFNK